MCKMFIANDIQYIFIGCIFYGFGLKWCYEYAKFWVSLKSRDDQGSTKTIRFREIREQCGMFLRRHPVEGALKLMAAGVGLTTTLISDSPMSLEYPKVVYATIYLFFAFSGLVDVLNFYFPQNISDGLVKMTLAQSFFIEGFLFLTNFTSCSLTSVILVIIVWITALAVSLELVWPETKLLRACTTLLHGQWIAHMMRASCLGHSLENTNAIALAFAWHMAAASTMTLCVVAVTRIYSPRFIVEEPPEIPLYDCYQQCDRRM